MIYNQLFIYRQLNKDKYTSYDSYNLCQFICDRPDKNVYIACYTSRTFYFEIPYSDEDNMFSLISFKHFIKSDINNLLNKIAQFNEIDLFFKTYSNDQFNMYRTFNKYIGLKKELLFHENILDDCLKNKNINDANVKKQIERINRIILDLKKGIKRNYKRLYKFFLLSPQYDSFEFHNFRTNIVLIKNKITKNKVILEDITNAWCELDNK